MAKANSRKHGAHQKKPRAHRIVKAHARRSGSSRTSVAERPIVVQPDAEIVEEEFVSRSEARVVDEDSDDEFGIYSPSRGETAGDEATG